MKKTMFDIVQNDLVTLETELLSVVQSPVKLISDIGTHLTQAGGKRLRPALYLLCAKSRAEADTAERAIPMAVAIELIHMATLVHDDVIDEAATRRGQITANARWGNHSSVLAGDYLFAKAFSLISGLVNNNMLKILAEVICSMCEGEIIQNKDIYNPQQTEEEYLVRIAKKTADFLAASCVLGGMTAELSETELAALRCYGYSLGMAFQITDDILDVTASSEQLGKPAGNDLRQGIVTLPVIYALQHSADREELRSIVTERNMADGQVARGLEIMHGTKAVEYCYSRVDDYLNEARQCLPASLPEEIRETLITIADYVGLRNY
ncbi:heptaprenyl diphosphate synthase [Propionispora hippei DSM 15287]|uniref:Heptaprenyl diphosphate synthase n=2 Tax=Propionispora TaxID=112902 RepID=A0A1M6A430_9FIRM|nr:heptaprenyl diphosphate synthase [Propionispora hippei DSM 15287]